LQAARELAAAPSGAALLLSQGLGLQKILAVFLAEQARLQYSLVFLLNFSDEDVEYINRLNDVSAGLTGQAREVVKIKEQALEKKKKAYLEGGNFSISPNILLYDLLSRKLSSALVTVLVINQIEEI